MAFDLSLNFQLSAQPHRVMKLLTDAALIRRWSGGEAVFENKEGGAFSMFDGWVTGTVIKTTENEMACTWQTTEWPQNATPSEVHYLLKKNPGGALVTLIHTGLPDEEEVKAHKAGWTDFFFDPLEDYIMIFEQDK